MVLTINVGALTSSKSLNAMIFAKWILQIIMPS